MNHSDIVEIGRRWLKTNGCKIIVSEQPSWSGTGEIPDIVGWKGNESILLEAKTSRADFRADQKKKFRINQDKGIGIFRLYIAPIGLLKVDEIPKNWGLLEVYPSGKVMRTLCWKGNVPHNFGSLKRMQANMLAERDLLLSVIRKYRRENA
jgi:hypothetical protein